MDDELIDKINNFYSKRPTQIQIESLGISLDKKEGKSLGIIRAPGGSGKTLCYAIPAL
jgi:CRISPR/Cas system-associated endonuclease/helicase Cas3